MEILKEWCLELSSVIGKLFSKLGIIWVCNSNFLTINFMKYNYPINISDENLTFELKCALSLKKTHWI